jgi:uncharacterized protein YdhG (YjbR/CyaY superfamily)
MMIDELYGKLSAPACRALQALRISELEDLAKFEKSSIEELHGIGPGAMRVIEKEMAFLNIAFRGVKEKASEKEIDAISQVDAYIGAFPQHVQDKLEEIRRIIYTAVPGATETISYGIPTFVLSGNLVHYAGYEKHIGFYPGSSGIATFKDDLAGYKSAKGSVQFPLDKPLPKQVITKIVRFRVEENLKKARKSKKKK